MKLKSLVLAAALLPAVAFADDFTIDLTAGVDGLFTGAFGTSHAGDGTSFTDTFTFNYGATGGSVFGWLQNVTNPATQSNLDFTSVTLNGVNLWTLNTPYFSSAQFSNMDVTGPVTLVVNGVVNGSAGSYAGTIDVAAPVPEPATYGMMIGGMGVLAFLARRRKQQ